MKRFFKIVASITLCVILISCLSSCENSSNDEYYRGYHDGYAEGYNKGFIKGQKELGGYARASFDDACGNTYGIEEALTILTLYADGESFSEEEIFSAIQIVSLFYDEVCDVIRDVEYNYKY